MARQPLTGPANTVYSIAFSHDGRLLAAGSADGTVRLWDVANPARPTPVAGREGSRGRRAVGYVQSVAFSADGGRSPPAPRSRPSGCGTCPARRLPPVPQMPLTGPAGWSPASRSALPGRRWRRPAKITRSGSGRCARREPPPADGTLAGAIDWANAVAFSPDGRSLAEGTSDASVLVWNLATRAITATLDQPQPVTSVAWDGQDRIAASDADGAVASGRCRRRSSAGNSPESVAYSPDGRTLAVGGTSVQLWNVATHTLLVTRALPPQVTVNATAFSPAGTGGGGGALQRDGRAAVRADAGTARQAVRGDDRSGTAESVAFSPDGALLATGADDGSLRLFDVADPRAPGGCPSARFGRSVYTVAFAPDGATVAAASVDDVVRLWHVSGAGARRSAWPGGPPLGRAGELRHRACLLPRQQDPRRRQRRQDGAAVERGPARAPGPIGTPLTGPSGYVWAAAFSPDGKTLAVGVTDGTVWLWNVAEPVHPALIATLTGPASDVYSVAFSPSGDAARATSFRAPSTSGTPAQPPRAQPSARTSASRSPRRSGRATSRAPVPGPLLVKSNPSRLRAPAGPASAGARRSRARPTSSPRSPGAGCSGGYEFLRLNRRDPEAYCPAASAILRMCPASEVTTPSPRRIAPSTTATSTMSLVAGFADQDPDPLSQFLAHRLDVAHPQHPSQAQPAVPRHAMPGQGRVPGPRGRLLRQ